MTSPSAHETKRRSSRMSGGRAPAAWPSEPDNEQFFEFETILAHDAPRDLYLVLWSGYRFTECTWEPRHHLPEAATEAHRAGASPKLRLLQLIVDPKQEATEASAAAGTDPRECVWVPVDGVSSREVAQALAEVASDVASAAVFRVPSSTNIIILPLHIKLGWVVSARDLPDTRFKWVVTASAAALDPHHHADPQQSASS